MRVLCLILLCSGCSASMVLKQPVVDQCKGSGLQGCEQITDGVLAYIDGDEEKGRAKLVEGAAQNNPEQMRQFAAGLNALRELPGMSDQLGALGEVAAILAGRPVATGSSTAAAPRGASWGPDPSIDSTEANPRRVKLRAETISLGDQRRRACKDTVSETASCVVAHSGTILITDVVFDGKCEGAFVAALPRNVLTTTSARWALRRQVSSGAWNVEADEVFVVGGSDGTSCDVSWAGNTR